jgi:hypothetical protein
MIPHIGRQLAHCTLAFCALVVFCVCTRAAEPQSARVVSQPSTEPLANGSAYGVLAESYPYHRQGYAKGGPSYSTIAPATGWYRYGFPTQTHRWGWFGAERYYPRVVWHRGYHGDCCRWAYRHGY